MGVGCGYESLALISSNKEVILKRLFLMLALVCGACTQQPESTKFLETEVDYGVPMPTAYQAAGLMTRGSTDAFDIAQKASTVSPVSGRYSYQMAVIPWREYSREMQGRSQQFRPATPAELVAFTAQHPEEMVGRKGVCALYDELTDSSGFHGYAVVSGGKRLGLWRTCHSWVLLVQDPPPPLGGHHNP